MIKDGSDPDDVRISLKYLDAATAELTDVISSGHDLSTATLSEFAYCVGTSANFKYDLEGSTASLSLLNKNLDFLQSQAKYTSASANLFASPLAHIQQAVGQKNMMDGRLNEAIASFKQALEQSDKHTTSPSELASRFMSHLQLYYSLFIIGKAEEAEQQKAALDKILAEASPSDLDYDVAARMKFRKAEVDATVAAIQKDHLRARDGLTTAICELNAALNARLLSSSNYKKLLVQFELEALQYIEDPVARLTTTLDVRDKYNELARTSGDGGYMRVLNGRLNFALAQAFGSSSKAANHFAELSMESASKPSGNYRLSDLQTGFQAAVLLKDKPKSDEFRAQLKSCGFSDECIQYLEESAVLK